MPLIENIKNIDDFQGLIMCVDIGLTKTGIAISDASRTLAFPMCVMRGDENSPKGVLDIASKHDISLIVCGFPFGYEESESANHIVKFINTMLDSNDSSIILWDEYGSSKAVRESYYSGRQKFKKRVYQNYDSKAASVILQDFLSYHRQTI